MTTIEKTIKLIDSIFRSEAIPYTIIGGIANIIHGSGRTTEDIDLVIHLELEDFENTINILINEFIPLKENPLHFFRSYFVLPLKHKTYGTRIDVSAALSEFERKAIQRSTRKSFGISEANFCTPEDLILFKLVAHRDQDIIDVRELINRLKDSIDQNYLLTTAKLFGEIDRQDIYEFLIHILGENKG